MGANDAQTVKAFLEAEAHDGPSLIIAYSHCIAHGIDMAKGMTSAEDGGRLRTLAALSLRSKPRPQGKNRILNSTRRIRALR